MNNPFLSRLNELRHVSLVIDSSCHRWELYEKQMGPRGGSKWMKIDQISRAPEDAPMPGRRLALRIGRTYEARGYADAEGRGQSIKYRFSVIAGPNEW